MWGTDMTAGSTQEQGHVAVFVAVDHCTEIRLALIDFRQAYNERGFIERHGHRLPARFRRDQMDTLPLAA
jgi:hypothetical protein